MPAVQLLALSSLNMEPEAGETSEAAENTPAHAVAVTIPVPASNKAKRRSRAVSVFAKSKSCIIRPGRIPRRPYSAYTKRAGESDNIPKYDDPQSNREWWRFFMNVSHLF